MKIFLLALLAFPIVAQAKIEDNSFLLEEAFNQEWGVYQFIQKYQKTERSNGYDYTFENEIPIADKVHQFSYEFDFSRPDGMNNGEISDLGLNYRWQPFNKDGIVVAERLGLVIPTGRVKNGAGNGVVGFEYMQSATLTLDPKWMNHWNLGFSLLPNAKTAGHNKRGTILGTSAGTSLIYLLRDDFNLMLEALLESGQSINPDGTKTAETAFTINPGFRWAWDFDFKDTQIVPGVSFPTEVLNDKTSHGVLLYLSIEPKFY